ncbi:MAG: hypothetical protein OEL75_03035 [Kiritimatiellaceae bacterium]|nr:hypothetical protein [Kiritimatiellaceae bacterium]
MMKWHLSGMHWMGHKHQPHAHAMHATHWAQNHPMVIALLLAGALALIIIALASKVDTGIRPSVLDSKYPAMHPYGPVF